MSVGQMKVANSKNDLITGHFTIDDCHRWVHYVFPTKEEQE